MGTMARNELKCLCGFMFEWLIIGMFFLLHSTVYIFNHAVSYDKCKLFMFVSLYIRITLSITCIFPYKFTFCNIWIVQVNHICSIILSVRVLFYILRVVKLYCIFSCTTRWYICQYMYFGYEYCVLCSSS